MSRPMNTERRALNIIDRVVLRLMESGLRADLLDADALNSVRPSIARALSQPASAGEGLEVLKVAYYAGWDHCLERIRKPSVDAVHEDWVHFSNKLAAPTPPATAQEDGRDAARYRWLRDAAHDWDIYYPTDKNASGIGAWLGCTDKDAAIDAAMLTSPDSGKEG